MNAIEMTQQINEAAAYLLTNVGTENETEARYLFVDLMTWARDYAGFNIETVNGVYVATDKE